MVHAAAHITGGGLIDNLARALPEGRRARVTRRWPQPPIFPWLQHAGGLQEDNMIRTFNLGIGMVLVTSPEDTGTALRVCGEAGVPGFDIGEIVSGPKGVDLL
jgi:phosphoribosylformylglycinamidine cyclo-ligase